MNYAKTDLIVCFTVQASGIWMLKLYHKMHKVIIISAAIISHNYSANLQVWELCFDSRSYSIGSFFLSFRLNVTKKKCFSLVNMSTMTKQWRLCGDVGDVCIVNSGCSARTISLFHSNFHVTQYTRSHNLASVIGKHNHEEERRQNRW